MKQTLNNHPEKKPHREIAALMESERPHLLRYACYRLGNADDAEDAVQDIFLQLHTKKTRCRWSSPGKLAQLPLSKPFQFLHRPVAPTANTAIRADRASHTRQ